MLHPAARTRTLSLSLAHGISLQTSDLPASPPSTTTTTPTTPRTPRWSHRFSFGRLTAEIAAVPLAPPLIYPSSDAVAVPSRPSPHTTTPLTFAHMDWALPTYGEHYSPPDNSRVRRRESDWPTRREIEAEAGCVIAYPGEASRGSRVRYREVLGEAEESGDEVGTVEDVERKRRRSSVVDGLKKGLGWVRRLSAGSGRKGSVDAVE
ncbi:uncharacterized protein BDZ99DRAFT_465577 [Mytilinidion resinicola]|uniref:Uncharacterized protein n=1 Tax=Mytilinidion resinicola TaxID=574789 RepID=A0A6A6YE04_9PEZI|nr:uncharacterized protein BDZ99DRAFT_465577 [Mytilinidion resinicola]KAF2806788.1 hypothetical protein BDZ99DRAFT_465577 [Mytilinidion resinicola]